MNPDHTNEKLRESVPSALEKSFWWHRARREIISDTIQRFVAPGARLLDFGAGSGIIAERLTDLGYNVVAADISPTALAECRARGLDTLDLNTGWPAAHSADCILAGDVLEHLDDDVEILQRLRPALRAGGILIAAVPAYAFLWSGEDFISDHVRRYTRPLLERRVREAGFTVRMSSYFNLLLLPAIATVIICKRLLRPRDMYASDVRPLPNWQNEILYRIFAAERRVLPRFHLPAGASILLVAQVSS